MEVYNPVRALDVSLVCVLNAHETYLLINNLLKGY